MRRAEERARKLVEQEAERRQAAERRAAEEAERKRAADAAKQIERDK